MTEGADQTPRRKRFSKKTETVEVRVTPEEKAAFMGACDRRGRSASSVLRNHMRRVSSWAAGAPLRRKAMIATALTATALPAVLLLSPAGEPPEWQGFDAHIFAALDADGDGRLTLTEYQRVFRWPDDVHDAAGNLYYGQHASSSGQIFGITARYAPLSGAAQDIVVLPAGDPCRDEMTALVRNNITRWFRGMDANGDGYVSLEEFSRHRHALARWTFDQFDLDGDGVVTAEEFVAVGTGQARPRPEVRRPQPEGMAEDSFVEPARAEAPEACVAFAQSLGPDRRTTPLSQRTQQDLAARALSSFEYLDRAGDGVISFREYAAASYGEFQE
ncbi:MAG: EF-hand domain-containing protein [Maricaulaceae bacterium]|nr:EF-hand domain-containing protein [Maricaulaceae bacterium]